MNSPVYYKKGNILNCLATDLPIFLGTGAMLGMGLTNCLIISNGHSTVIKLPTIWILENDGNILWLP